MPFRLTNAPASFQNYMNDVFRDLIGQCIAIYLDDIAIYSENEAEHIEHVRMVLSRLRDNGFFGKIEKCVFNTNEVDFLGCVISHMTRPL